MNKEAYLKEALVITFLWQTENNVIQFTIVLRNKISRFLGYRSVLIIDEM